MKVMDMAADDVVSKSAGISTDFVDALGDLPSFPATMNYLVPSVERAYTDLVDFSKTITPTEEHAIRVYDARPIAQNLSLEVEGFTIQRRQGPSRVASNPELMEANRSRRFDSPPINMAYWEELLPMLVSLSGADEALPMLVASPRGAAPCRANQVGIRK